MTSPYISTQSVSYAATGAGSPVSGPAPVSTTDALLAKYFGGGAGPSPQSVSAYNYAWGGSYGGYGAYPYGSYGGAFPSSPWGSYPPAGPGYWQQQPPLNDNTALARIQSISGKLDAQNAGQGDGLIDVNDLRSALDDKSGKYSKADKDAIQYLLDNQNGLRGRVDHFDGQDDGQFSVDSLNKMVANPGSQGVLPLDQKMTNTQALMALQSFMKDHNWGILNREGLSHIAQYGDTEEQKAAAKKLLNNADLFKAADTGEKNDGRYDGKIDHADLRGLINRADVDKIGASATSPMPPAGGAPYTPIYSGNYYADAYYNNMYASTLGPATALYQNAPGAPPR